jgi:5-formyltetrahydrofolate cyclo-ligase
MLERRDSLSAKERERLGRLAQEHVIATGRFQSAKVVGAYFATGSEVRTGLIIDAAKRLGKTVTLPRVEGDMITFYEFSSETDLAEGRFGIMEPRPLSLARPDLVIVPGIAFDAKGCRIGYGKGYYDRFLSRHGPFSMGLGYSLQLVDELPKGRLDRRLDALATENGVTYF